MDAKVFRMALLTIISAFILVIVVIYATNADKIGALFGKTSSQSEASIEASEGKSVEIIAGQQIGDDLKSYLYDDDFFDEAEKIPAVVVIRKNTKTSSEGSSASSEASTDDEGTGMAVVGQLDNPGAGNSDMGGAGMSAPGGNILPQGPITEPPLEGTPVGNVP